MELGLDDRLGRRWRVCGPDIDLGRWYGHGGLGGFRLGLGLGGFRLGLGLGGFRRGLGCDGGCCGGRVGGAGTSDDDAGADHGTCIERRPGGDGRVGGSGQDDGVEVVGHVPARQAHDRSGRALGLARHDHLDGADRECVGAAGEEVDDRGRRKGPAQEHARQRANAFLTGVGGEQRHGLVYDLVGGGTEQHDRLAAAHHGTITGDDPDAG